MSKFGTPPDTKTICAKFCEQFKNNPKLQLQCSLLCDLSAKCPLPTLSIVDIFQQISPDFPKLFVGIPEVMLKSVITNLSLTILMEYLPWLLSLTAIFIFLSVTKLLSQVILWSTFVVLILVILMLIGAKLYFGVMTVVQAAKAGATQLRANLHGNKELTDKIGKILLSHLLASCATPPKPPQPETPVTGNIAGANPVVEPGGEGAANRGSIVRRGKIGHSY